MQRALSVVAASLALAVSLFAQETAASDKSRGADFTLSHANSSDLVEGPVAVERTGSFRALNQVWSGRGPLSLADNRFFSFPSAFGWIEAPSWFLPPFSARPLPRLVPPTLLGMDPVGEYDFAPQGDYVGGEVSVFYGKSTGKYSREVKAGHILGEIVHGNTHISVGASYEESSGRRPLLIGH